MKKIFFDFLNEMIFPQNGKCVVCSKVLFIADSNLCDNCKDKLIYTRKMKCISCSSFFEEPDLGEICSECRHKYGIIQNGCSLYKYSGTAKGIIQDFKYKNNPQGAYIVGERLYEKLKLYQWFSSVDIIIPVPISKQRNLQRGYNQSYYIAKAISDRSNIAIYEDCLIKIKETQDQIELSGKERFDNLKDCYSCDDRVFGKNILIVDDVFTTGATILECSKTMKDVGAAQIYMATVATTIV